MRPTGAALLALASSAVLLTGCRESFPSGYAAAPTSSPTALGTPSPATSNPTGVSDAHDVVTGLKDAGLPAESEIVFDASSDPDKEIGKPYGYSSRADFADARLTPGVVPTDQDGDVETGGSVEVFPDANTASAYAKGHKEPHPVPGEHDIVSVNVLLRLSPRLTSAEVDTYRMTLEAITGGHAELLE